MEISIADGEAKGYTENDTKWYNSRRIRYAEKCSENSFHHGFGYGFIDFHRTYGCGKREYYYDISARRPVYGGAYQQSAMGDLCGASLRPAV
jgi:hypothetical protein